MKTLLRSMFLEQREDQAAALENVHRFQATGLDFEVPQDQIIWAFVQRFVRAHDHVPETSTLMAHFDQGGEDEVYDRVRQLSVLIPKYRGDFEVYLSGKVEARQIRAATDLLKEANTILRGGLEVEGEKFKGPVAALAHVQTMAASVASIGGKKTHQGGAVGQDAKDFLAEVQRVRADPTAGVGRHSGIVQVDNAINGARPHELWIHLAFVGQLKSTLAINWLYQNATHFKWNGALLSLEMPYRQVRRILYALHSLHPTLTDERERFGISEGVPYQGIRDGELTDKEMAYLRVVADDLHQGQQEGRYGAMNILAGGGGYTVDRLRAEAERLHQGDGLHLLFLDHAGLMSAARTRASSTTEHQNEVIRDLKLLAMDFDRGLGLPVVCLYQINRTGYQAALKRKEKTGLASYDLTAASYSNEVERSSDVITAGWVDDDLRKANRLQLQCLKSRDQAPFDPCLVEVNWPYRCLSSLSGAAAVAGAAGQAVHPVPGLSEGEMDNVMEGLTND